ncbi:MAG: PIN domain-containing protein [Oscillospiraceae bacterium]|nr:PIN domain-containing protein [Oscillospiraceae bacterium]
MKVYLDTSVISYLDQQDAPEQMKETREVWERIKAGQYDVFISDVVLRELADCKDEAKRDLLIGHLAEIKYNLIAVDDDIAKLAEKIVTKGVLKQKNIDDCQHIAAAILSDCDIIVSWNFKHIVNVKTIRGIKVITTVEGFKDLLIYQPTALLNEED